MTAIPVAFPIMTRIAHNRMTAPPAVNKRLDRLAPGMTLGAVARGTGYRVEFISRIFNRKRKPSLTAAQSIAKFLGVGLDTLVAALNYR